METRFKITKHITDLESKAVKNVDLNKPEKDVKELINVAIKYGYYVSLTYKDGSLNAGMITYENAVKGVNYFFRKEE